MMYRSTIYILLTLLLCSCELRDKEPNYGGNISEESNLLILCEGLMNMNNSTLSKYDANRDTIISKFFLKCNGRGLGDTANDMKRYGSKTYILVNVSSQIEIIDNKTGKSLKQIPLFNEEKKSRQPRNIEFHNDKAYVTCFDGTLLRIDTTLLAIDGMVKCGKNPEGLTIANNKIYVANSGGLDFPKYDSTVSVVNILPFEHVKYITVGLNPVSIDSDSEGDVYVITNGDYGNEDYCMYRINSHNDILEQTFSDINPLNITIHKDKAYMYSYDYNNDKQWFKIFDCIEERIENNNFITDGTKIEKPYGIDINPRNGDIIITEAYQYVTWGDVLCFSKEGKLKYRIDEVGLNPNTVTFY